MMKKLIKIFTMLFIIFGLSSCVNSNSKEYFDIQYSDEEINKESFDNYFKSNKDLYPSYETLKENNPNILDNIKQISLSNFKFKIFRFSNDSMNGFLEGETFIYNNGSYFNLGIAFGGYGVTEFIVSQENGESWLYFLYSYGSGIHRTEIGLFNLKNNEYYYINELPLEMHIDYSLVLDKENKSIDIYTAEINPIYNDDNFNTYSIIKKEIVFESIEQFTKKKIEIPKEETNNDSSSGPWYGANCTPVVLEEKEATCLEEGYIIIGCTDCVEIYERTILPIVDCCYENNECIWCGTKINNEPFFVAAIPQDIEYNGRHYRMLQGVGIKTTITKDEVGELLGYIIGDDDVEAFTQEYPDTDYIVYEGIYDYNNDNRVPFFSIKKHEDLSYICVRVEGVYNIYQDITDLI